MGIKRIAEKAKVSIATVSRVLNGTKAVSEDLRQKVMDAIEEDGYVADHIARSMVLKKTFTIGLIIPNISSLYHQVIFLSIEEELEKQGYRVIVCRVKDEPDHEKVYLDLLLKNRTDGILLMHETKNPEIYKKLDNSDIPIVLCGIDIPEITFPQVSIDDYRATFDGMEYLISLGHKKIGLICGVGFSAGDNRVKGFKDSLAKHSIELPPDYIISGDYTIRSGHDAIISLYAKHRNITAVFVASDEMAIGVLSGIREMGKSVPEDISVLGFDGIDISPYLIPPLTTVQQPIGAIGEVAAKILIKMIDEENPEQKHIIMKHEIVIRDSCRKI